MWLGHTKEYNNFFTGILNHRFARAHYYLCPQRMHYLTFGDARDLKKAE